MGAGSAPTRSKDQRVFVTAGWKWAPDSTKDLRFLAVALGYRSIAELTQRALEAYLTTPEAQKQLSAVDPTRRLVAQDLRDLFEGRR